MAVPETQNMPASDDVAIMLRVVFLGQLDQIGIAWTERIYVDVVI